MTQEINATNKRGIADIYAGTTAYNANARQIEKAVDGVKTSFIARVDSCASSGISGATTVNATPLTAQTDGAGNALPSPSYPALPFSRMQAGIAALIVNPVPGDIGVFVCQRRDSSNISTGAATPQPPASFGGHGASGAVMTGAIHTKTPEVWVEIAQDKTITIHGPAKVVIESDAEVCVTAPLIKLNGNVQVSGSLVAQGNVTGAGISLNSHTHGGVETGGGSTGRPN